jgi:hypothetical protein
MKIKLGQEAPQLTREACTDVVQSLVQAQCGVAFAKFLSAVDRLKAASKAKVSKIPLYDVRGGLKTAERAAELAHKALVGGHLSETAKKALSLSKSAGRLVARYKGDGAVAPEEIPKLRQSVEGIGQKFKDLIDEVRKGCT